MNKPFTANQHSKSPSKKSNRHLKSKSICPSSLDADFCNVSSFKTPIGWISLEVSGQGVRKVSLSASSSSKRNQLGAINANRISKSAIQQLTEYFEGRRSRFDLPLDLKGTDFQKKVWAALCTIPHGETRSYGELAKAIGSPKAARAVGMANNKNPIAIIVPCHRVIGKNGALVGYAGGLGRKKTLLDLESEKTCTARSGI